MSTLNNPLFYAIPLISRAPWSPAVEVDPEKKERFASKPSGCNMLTFVTSSFYLDVKWTLLYSWLSRRDECYQLHCRHLELYFRNESV